MTKPEKSNILLTYLLPKLRDVLFVAILLGAMSIAPRMLNQDGDTGRHITIGRLIIADLKIPRTDVFSHTMIGEPLTPHEWLAQVLFGIADNIFGLGGVVWLVGVLLAATFFIVYSQALRRSNLPLLGLALTLLGVAAASLHFLARPHIFTLFFVSVWVIMMERVRLEQPLRIWIPAVLMMIWANTHGAFLTGFVIWAAYTLEPVWLGLKNKPFRFTGQMRKWFTVGGLAFVASLINPAGLGLWKTAFDFLSSRFLVGHTQEYLPPDFHQASALPFLVMIGISIFLLAIKRSPMQISHCVLLAGWTILGLYSARNIPIYAVIAVPILAQATADGLNNRSGWLKFEQKIRTIEDKLKGNLWPWVSSIAVLFALAFSPAVREHARYDAQIFPVEAVNWVESNPQSGRMFNYFPWGGYLLYRLFPEYQVFIDGQTDFYGEAMTREYAAVISVNPGWQAVLNRYAVEWAILPINEPVVTAMLNDGWREVYRDSTSLILRRSHINSQ